MNCRHRQRYWYHVISLMSCNSVLVPRGTGGLTIQHFRQYTLIIFIIITIHHLETKLN